MLRVTVELLPRWPRKRPPHTGNCGNLPRKKRCIGRLRDYARGGCLRRHWHRDSLRIPSVCSDQTE